MTTDIREPTTGSDDHRMIASIHPQECSTQGGETLTVHFSSSLPEDPIVIILRGSECTHKLQAERIEDTVLTTLLPAHSKPETVQLSVYILPSPGTNMSSTYQAVLLVEDVLVYVDKSITLLAEKLIHSVVDKTQASVFYSMLPPFADMSISQLCEFDQKLRDAVSDVELPEGWSLVVKGHAQQETLFHFASRNNLPNLFSLLLNMPGGKDGVLIPNEQGQYPIDLAKDCGSHSITRIIENLERKSSSLACPLPSINLPEGKTSPHLMLMREIHCEWIQNQRLQNGSLNGISVPGAPPKAHRPNSIAVMEGLNLADDNYFFRVCLNERGRRKSWSLVLGRANTRSVDTGINELDRVTDQIMAYEQLQEVKNMQSSHVLANRGAWLDRWSFSCPMLNDNRNLVDTDIIHSTLTSPGLLEEPPVFLSESTFTGNDPDHLNNSSKHFPLLVSSNEGASSISPAVVLPQVCIEDEHMRKVCVQPVSGAALGRNLAELNQLPSDTDTDEEINTRMDSVISPLSSKSEPSFHTADDETPPNEQRGKMSKSYSTSSANKPSDDSKVRSSFDSTALSNNFTEVDEELGGDCMRTKSAVFAVAGSSSSNDISTTPNSSPSTLLNRTHHKSHSVSNVPFQFEELSKEATEKESDMYHLVMPPQPDDSRSRGSSFVSTSSKMDDSSDTSDDSEDDDFEAPPTSDGPILLGLRVMKEDGIVSSEDDLLDGEFSAKGRVDRRFSEVKVTMIGGSSDSEGEGINMRPIHRSSTADDALSHSSQSMDERKAESLSPVPKSSEKRDIVTDSSKGGVTSSPIFRREIHSVGSFSPNSSPKSGQSRFPDAKSTVSKLQLLMKQDENFCLLDKGALSDDSNSFKHAKKKVHKSHTLPPNSPSNQPTKSQVEHAKLARNTSTTSETKVPYTKPKASNLDFMKPHDSQTSPRSSNTTSHGENPNANPQSPLFFSKRSFMRFSDDGVTTSPNPGSPLERKVSKSVDDLFDPINEEEESITGAQLNKTTSAAAGARKKEENSVKLIRFKNLPENDQNTDEETNSIVHKDIESYLGIKMEEKEPTKKGTFKLFRRDSNKNKNKPKKYEQPNNSNADLSSSVIQSRTKSQASPVLVKTRAHTIHGGDFALPPQLNEVQTKGSNRSSQYSSSNGRLGDSISPVREESVSPVSPPEDDKSMSLNIEDFAELMPTEEADLSWNRTVDRRLRKQMSKHEKGRQGVIYDWITTERHIFRAYQILKRVFYDKFKSELKMSDDDLNLLFPSLSTLLQVSKEFLQRLQDRQRQSGTLIQDISDILLDQFTGEKGETMKSAYTDFICLYPATMEVYREFERRKQKFNRLINMLYQNKVCERKKLPDFYLLITQRVSKYVEMMKKLVKETEALKLDHLGRVKEASVALTDLVNSIDRGVYEYNNRKELTAIQTRLEIHLPKGMPKSKKLKSIKSLDFTAQNRFLLKRGEAIWQGHGKQLTVQIILVTDFLALLTERDQKYHLANLQDLQPPIIKLYDLHVRVNASVKSGIQLLLLEQGVVPEMFRLEFQNKKLAKEWEEALNSAVGHCKENELKCDYFGAEPVFSGDEMCKEEEDEKSEVPDYPTDNDMSPNSYRRVIMDVAIEQAEKILSTSLTATSSVSLGRSMTTIEEVKESPRPQLKNSKQPVSRSQTQRGNSVDESKVIRKKKSVERGRSFLDKKTQDDVGDRQVLLDCIMKLKESLEYVIEQREEQDSVIKKLTKELESLKEDRISDSSGSPALSRGLRGNSFSRNRPHSLHSDLFESKNS